MQLQPDHYFQKEHEWPAPGNPDRKIKVEVGIYRWDSVLDIQLKLIDPKQPEDQVRPSHPLGECPAFIDYLLKEVRSSTINYSIRVDYRIPVYLKEDCVQIGDGDTTMYVDPVRGKAWTDKYRVAIEANRHLGSSNYLYLGYPAEIEQMRTMSEKVPNDNLRLFQAKDKTQQSLTLRPQLFMECEVSDACRNCYFRPAVLKCSGLDANLVKDMMNLVDKVNLPSVEVPPVP